MILEAVLLQSLLRPVTGGMKSVKVICAALALFFQLRWVQGDEMCSSPAINYRIQTFNPGARTLLTCGLSGSGVRWWTSTAACGPFTQSHLCNTTGLNLCRFDVSRIENHFYHCCTSGETVENSLAQVIDSRNCVRVEVCAMIIEDSISKPPYFYSDDILHIFIQVYSHPAPNQSHTAILGPTNTQLNSEVSNRQLDPIQPIFTFQFSIPIPPIEEMQDFTLGISFRGVCTNNLESASVVVPIFSRGVATAGPTTHNLSPPTIATSSSPAIEGVQGQQQQGVDEGLLLGLLIPLLLFMGVSLVLCVAVVYLWRRLQKLSSNRRPTSLDVQPQEYRRLPSRDQPTPSPAVAYMNTPGQNGSHAATTPSSLAFPHSHTGQTPLIPPTPDDNQPFITHLRNEAAEPPPYGQLVKGANDGPVQGNGSRSNGGPEYATPSVSGSQGGRGPQGGCATEALYDNAIISQLAQEVKLSGADVANQTDV